ncbi:hypothetical protein CesoFtcFv8_007912 [Champsocephalus esox]|uniref:Uncharacterized protein n=1 Tax=Champsocephalus esox TaxID=159716 RepID=A0AAN8H519_9TELE|nr:hypothetical protein CesoFtcFv8_007912 [Champsocephalus esox]
MIVVGMVMKPGEMVRVSALVILVGVVKERGVKDMLPALRIALVWSLKSRKESVPALCISFLCSTISRRVGEGERVNRVSSKALT